MTLAPNSTAARDVAYHLHPYTNVSQFEADGPLIITEGKGVYVKDEAGKQYLEAMSGLWCTSLGFGEPRLVEAAARQLRRLPNYHNFAGRGTDVTADLAERLIAIAPHSAEGPMSKAFFVNSGSEANDTQVKLVWYYNNVLGRPQKKKIIARSKAYHGVTIVAASLTGLAYVHNGFDLPLERFLHTDCPHYWRYAEAGESEEDFASRLADNLDRLIIDEGPDTVAAFIAEPVMGAGGVILPPVGYFEKIQAVLRKHDVLLIADEVITGFCRTGRMFGCETYDIRPDLVTVAKALSSGYLPIAAVVLSERIYEVLKRGSDTYGVFGHGYTYSGHPVPAAVALETLKIYEERDIAGRTAKLSPRLLDGLNALADHPLVGEVRGVGLIAGVELVADKETKQSFEPGRKVGAIFDDRARRLGLLVRPLASDVIAVCPPLVISESEIDTLLERFAWALDETQAAVEARESV